MIKEPMCTCLVRITPHPGADARFITSGRFQKLKFLNFKGNPMCNELDYKKYVLAFIDGESPRYLSTAFTSVLLS